MGKALYRTYRSKSLDEIVGQEHITKSLSAAITSGSINHAYLFTGPRGVGKTSIARIFAHQVNNLPYTDEDSHLDIIEIDAASNRGIEDVRELRDKVHIVPTSARYKVYIIDEIHMLTTPAFNALLKTLEEPPAHVVFILATTEMHKLPETIVSRTQHYAFRPVPKKQVITHLRSIATAENITITDDALGLIADYGGGSFRDSIGLLDQIQNFDTEITVDTVRSLTGIAPEESIQALMSALVTHSPSDVVMQLYSLKEQGVEAAAIAKQLSSAVESDILSKKPSFEPHVGLNVIRSLIDVPGSVQPFAALQVCLLNTAFEPTIAAYVAPSITVERSVRTDASKKPKSHTLEEQPDEVVKVSDPNLGKETAKKPEKQAVQPPINSSKEMLSSEDWSSILIHVKQKYNTLYGVLRMAEADIQPGKITLKLRFSFHQKRLNDPKNKDIIIQSIESVTGHKLMIECIVAEDAKPSNLPAPALQAKKETESPKDDSTFHTVSNIFGSAELLES